MSALPTPHNNVCVAGAGVSGRGCAELIHRIGWPLIIADDNADAGADCADSCDGRWMSVAGAIEHLDEIDLVVTSPGWRPDSPLLRAAAERGIPVIGDVELAWLADQDGAFGEPRTWLAITGTNGKTTTTAMATAMLQQAGRAAEAVGNIGTAVGTALTAQPRISVMVAELSSFQLHWAPDFAPAAGVVLNIADDHLDWHGSRDNYGNDKLRALRGPVKIINADCPVTGDMLREHPELHDDPDLVSFTLSEPSAGQLGVRDGRLIDCAFGDDVDLGSAETISPPGPAGVADALAAAAIARSQGVAAADISTALKNFTVRNHRGAVVHNAGGVRWINNSNANNPHATDGALAGIESIIWVAGGQLKGASINEVITHHSERLKAAIVLGQDRTQIVRTLQRLSPHTRVVTIDDQNPQRAMDEVGRVAAALATEGDTVVLAPAAASLDMFSGMAQRGDLFAAAAARYGKQ